jgi:chemotaxis protein MotB
MKKKHPEHVNLERWLVSYADFITLLFAFFVVMYAISQADLTKFQKVATGIRAAFANGPTGMIDLSAGSGGNTLSTFENVEPPGGRVVNLPAGKTNTAAESDPELQEVKELMEESVSLEMSSSEAAKQLDTQYDSRGLVVRISAQDIFEEGQFDVNGALLPLLDRIGRVLAKTKRIFRVEGHTDLNETERVRTEFSSDWELSSARASWLAKYWIKKFDLDPARVGVAGYSHNRLLTKSRQPMARSKNRRVEVIILNQAYEAP